MNPVKYLCIQEGHRSWGGHCLWMSDVIRCFIVQYDKKSQNTGREKGHCRAADGQWKLQRKMAALSRQLKATCISKYLFQLIGVMLVQWPF